MVREREGQTEREREIERNRIIEWDRKRNTVKLGQRERVSERQTMRVREKLRTETETAELPVSNSYPFSTKVWQQPPAWSCCSSTSTLLPALANNNAATRPPAPLPITITSRSSGTLPTLNPANRKLHIFLSTVLVVSVTVWLAGTGNPCHLFSPKGKWAGKSCHSTSLWKLKLTF